MYIFSAVRLKIIVKEETEMSEFFKNIGKIPFEGKDSANPLAFKYYNPDEVVAGKTMREQLKFALSWWHTMGGDGTDMFGCGTADKTWGESDSAARAKAKVDAAFEIMDKLSIDYFCFHDRVRPRIRSRCRRALQ